MRVENNGKLLYWKIENNGKLLYWKIENGELPCCPMADHWIRREPTRTYRLTTTLGT